jgi:predicted ATPase
VIAHTGEDWCQAEWYRLKGQLLLQLSSDNHTETEACFHQALDIARRQEAKSWELHAATSLARLWQSQDKRQDAYDCWHQCTNGSRRGLTRRICRRPKHYSKNLRSEG